HHALFHVDAATGLDLADQVHLHLAAQLLVGLFLGRGQDLFGVGFQFPDGIGVAGVHGQGDHALHGGEVQFNDAVVVGHVGGFEFLVGFGTAVLDKVLLGDGVGLPDGGPAGGFGGHDIDAVAVVR